MIILYEVIKPELMPPGPPLKPFVYQRPPGIMSQIERQEKRLLAIWRARNTERNGETKEEAGPGS
ncbi:predicted protein, partial [Arabidopsis lyrata subsp. lyrata]